MSMYVPVIGVALKSVPRHGRFTPSVKINSSANPIMYIRVVGLAALLIVTPTGVTSVAVV
jgi:hypothetical protein